MKSIAILMAVGGIAIALMQLVVAVIIDFFNPWDGPGGGVA